MDDADEVARALAGTKLCGICKEEKLEKDKKDEAKTKENQEDTGLLWLLGAGIFISYDYGFSCQAHFFNIT